jgi:hypothetical protein
MGLKKKKKKKEKFPKGVGKNVFGRKEGIKAGHSLVSRAKLGWDV